MNGKHPFGIYEVFEVEVRSHTRLFKTLQKALAPALKPRLGLNGHDKLPEPSSIKVLVSFNGRASRPQAGGLVEEGSG